MAAVLGAHSAPGADASPLGADAIWAWHWDDTGQLVDAVAAGGFNRVYLYAQGGFGPKVRGAIAALNERGVAVEALAGERRWATTQRGGLLAFVRRAARYQRGAPAGARLAGIHLDIEPHSLPSWNRDQETVGRSLVDSLRVARREANRLPLTADIPFWFDGIRLGRRSLAEAVMRATDATTIMAYRDTAPRVIEVARREIRIAGRLGKPTAVGVETDAVRPRSITFHEEGGGALREALEAIRMRFAGQRGFGGLAVHHLGSLLHLEP